MRRTPSKLEGIEQKVAERDRFAHHNQKNTLQHGVGRITRMKRKLMMAEPGPIAEFHNRFDHSRACKSVSSPDGIQVHRTHGIHGKGKRETKQVAATPQTRRVFSVSLLFFRVFRVFRGLLFPRTVLISHGIARIRVIRPIRGWKLVLVATEGRAETFCSFFVIPNDFRSKSLTC
jgi:hypothetical protein